MFTYKKLIYSIKYIWLILLPGLFSHYFYFSFKFFVHTNCILFLWCRSICLRKTNLFLIVFLYIWKNSFANTKDKWPNKRKRKFTAFFLWYNIFSLERIVMPDFFKHFFNDLMAFKTTFLKFPCHNIFIFVL